MYMFWLIPVHRNTNKTSLLVGTHFNHWLLTVSTSLHFIRTVISRLTCTWLSYMYVMYNKMGSFEIRGLTFTFFLAPAGPSSGISLDTAPLTILSPPTCLSICSILLASSSCLSMLWSRFCALNMYMVSF